MALFDGPEQHADNAPQTWIVFRDTDYRGRPYWSVRDKTGEHTIENARTKREATEKLTSGWAFDLWHKEARWYAGENVHPWKPWSVVKAEREATDKRNAEWEREKARKIERMGVTPEKMTEWQNATTSEQLGAVQDAAAEMHDVLTQNNLLSVDLLTPGEAVQLKRELNAQHGLDASEYISDWIDRIRYQGLDSHLSALDVLEIIRDQMMDHEVEIMTQYA